MLKKTPDIEISHLSFSYNSSVESHEVISQMSWIAQGKEAIGIIGANGAGKSTLLKLMVGLQLNYSGILRIGGTDVEKKTLSSIRKKIGYVFQDSESQLFMSRVFEDVAFAPRNHGFTPQEVEERTNEALKAVQIKDLKEEHIYRLSGGQKKLVSLATILSYNPEIILLDEPSIALDPRNRRNLIQVINKLDVLKIIASHDLDFIYDTCPRTILINKGKIIKDAPTLEILSDKALLEANGLELPLSKY